jgi:hypothetical protein
MLQSYKQLITGNYAVNETKTVDIDSIVTFTPITNAKITFYNASNETFNITVINRLYVMSPDDALLIVDQNFYITNNTALASGNRLEVLLNGNIDRDTSLYIVSVKNSGVDEANFYYVIEGVIDTAMLVTAPAYEI